MSDVRLILGDCREVLAGLAAESVDSCVCDPPYDLTTAKRYGKPGAAPTTHRVYSRMARGFMGLSWDATGVSFDPATWAEVARVLKPGAHLLAFGGTRTAHRMVCAIEDAGFEIRDGLAWLYATGFPKSHDVSKALDRMAGAEREVMVVRSGPRPGNHGGSGSYGHGEDRSITAPATDLARQWDGWGTALKPCFEPVVMARKPLSESSVAANVTRWGTGALNIAACRLERAAGDVPGWHETGADGTNGFNGSGTFRTRKQSAEEIQARCAGGRWAPNAMFDEEAAAELREASRYFFVAKPTRAERDHGCHALPKATRNRVNPGGLEHDPKWAPVQARNTHATVKPVELMQYLVRLVTPPSGVCLDPFTGSGTTGMACRREGFAFLGIEQSADYLEIARVRIEAERHLFVEEPEPVAPPPDLQTTLDLPPPLARETQP